MHLKMLSVMLGWLNGCFGKDMEVSNCGLIYDIPTFAWKSRHKPQNLVSSADLDFPKNNTAGTNLAIARTG
jgi:hypothetical protein